MLHQFCARPGRRRLRRLALAGALAAMGLTSAGCFWGPAALQGEVVDSQTGQRVQPAIITVAGRQLVSSTGTFSFWGLPEGTLRLRVEAPGYLPRSETVPVQADQTANVVVRLTPEGPAGKRSAVGAGPAASGPEAPAPSRGATSNLTLRVVDGFSGRRLPLWSFEVSVGGRSYTGYQGVLSLPGLRAGSLSLRVSSRYFETRQVSLTLPPGAASATVALLPIFPLSEVWNLASLVRAEAEGEPYLGQVAVAATVLNRVNSPLYPDSLAGVIWDREGGVQYEPVLNGRIYIAPDETAIRATVDALSGLDPTRGATGFYNPDKTDNEWVRSQPVTLRIGNHVFFR